MATRKDYQHDPPTGPINVPADVATAPTPYGWRDFPTWLVIAALLLTIAAWIAEWLRPGYDARTFAGVVLMAALRYYFQTRKDTAT